MGGLGHVEYNRGSFDCAAHGVSSFAQDDRVLGEFRFAQGGGAGVGREVGGGGLKGVEEEACAFEVDAVAGEAGGDLSEGFLEGGAIVEVLDEEGLVLDDGGDVLTTVVMAHVLVVHGGGAAAGTVLLRLVHALVRFGWFADEVFVRCGHVVPPRVYIQMIH